MNNKVLINRYLGYLQREGRAFNTLSAGATDLRQAQEFIGVPCASFTFPGRMEEYQKSLKKYSPNTQARKLTSLREFLIWARRKGYLRHDLAKTIAIPKRIIMTPMTILSIHQINRLRREANVTERLLLELMLQTGMRLAEATKIRMKDVDLKKSKVKSPRRWRDRRQSKVWIPMTEPLQQAIEYYLAAYSRGERSTLLTSGRTGGKMIPRTASNMLNRLAGRTGVRQVTGRNLRATFIVRQLEMGTPIATIGEIVGHGTLATTQKYLKLAKGKIKRRTPVITAL